MKIIYQMMGAKDAGAINMTSDFELWRKL